MKERNTGNKEEWNGVWKIKEWDNHKGKTFF
jgi:hypothetical protein